MPLGDQIRSRRIKAGMTLDDLAAKSFISKTYIWELENSEPGAKKPSADVLLKIASALGTTIGHLLELPVAKKVDAEPKLPESLVEFKTRAKQLGEDVSMADLNELARMSFRGGQPKEWQEWYELYRVFKRSSEAK